MAAWLAPSGLVFTEDKTHVVHLEEGFDFLGFNIRRYRRGRNPAKLLIKPSQDAVKRVRNRLATEMRALRGSNAGAVIARINPIIQGWSAYYRGAVSSKVFNALDNYMWWLTYRWATHPPHEVGKVDYVPLLRPIQQVQERPMGVRRPRHIHLVRPTTRPSTWSNSPGPTSFGMCRLRAGRPRTTPT
ncbi:MAG: group II intron maturase-specific domain-containing protein [Mycobacterium sp.]|nr:group II intron maturase-specific domain-containing protein [Mycobacterium sp.]